MKNLKKILQQTQNKYLNLFNVAYEINGQEYNYQFASRNNKKNLALIKKNPQVNVVRILPYYIEQGKIYIVMIKEFRYPINRFICSLPAGVVDENETPENSAKRELLEETGFRAKNIKQTEKCSFISAGMSDETCECYEAEVEKSQSQNLVGNEKIIVKIIEIENINKFLNEKDFDLQSKLLLRTFLYKKKIKKSEKEK